MNESNKDELNVVNQPEIVSYKDGKALSTEQFQKLESFPAGKISICKDQQIPQGYVIVSQGSSIACPGSFPNIWNIKRPGSTEVVCNISPIPSDYVKIAEGSSIGCPGSFPNTWTIQKV